MPPTLDMPPFPTLAFDYIAWEGRVVLRTWAGFQTRRGSYASISSPRESDGTVDLRVCCPEDDPVPPSPEQSAAFAYLVRNEQFVTDLVLSAVFESYPRFREETLYASDEDDEDVDLLIEITRPEQLRSLIGLSIVHILEESKDGLACVGFEFGCVWDGEHGLGVMTHGDRVLAIGGADRSFMLR